MTNLNQKLSEVEKAYLAGLFDGEGCISSSLGSRTHFLKKQHKKQTYYYPQIRFIITNRSRQLLEAVKDKLEYGNIYRNKESDTYNYTVTAQEEVMNIIDALSGQVRLKRRDLDLTKEELEYIRTRRHGHPQYHWTAEERQFIYDHYIVKLQKILPNGAKRGAPERTHTLKDKLS